MTQPTGSDHNNNKNSMSSSTASSDDMLSTEQLKEANEILSRDGEGMNLFAIHGYLTSIISAPIDIRVNEWFPVVLGLDPTKNLILQKSPIFKTDSDAEKVILVLHTLHEQITAILKSNKIFYPLVSLENPKMLMADAPIQNVQDWCNGYLHGVDNYIKAWSVIDKVFVPLVPFAIVSGSYPYEELVQGLGKFLNKEEDIKYCMETIPPSVKSLYRFWQANRYADIVKNKVTDKLRNSFKIWNDPCPCGSGNKFSECCATKPRE